MKEEVVMGDVEIKTEFVEDDLYPRHDDVPPYEFQTNDKSYELRPFKEKTSSAVNDHCIRKCSVVLFRMSMQEVLRWQNPENHSKDVEHFECDVCPFKSAHLGNLRRHEKKHSGFVVSLPFACTSCVYKASHRKQLEAHKRIHETSTKAYQCDICVFKTKVCRELVLHTKRHHPGVDLPFTCRMCKYWAGDHQKLAAHMKKHKELMKCKHCDYSSQKASDVALHMLIHTGERPYKCKHCDYSTGFSSNLLTHVKKHTTGEKPYKCDECDLRFGHLTTIKSHFLNNHNHSDNTPNRCVERDVKSKKKKNLNKIKSLMKIRNNAGKKLYKCDMCGFHTRHLRAMKPHINSHSNSGEGFLKCGACDFCAFSKDDLRQHERIHRMKASANIEGVFVAEQEEDLFEANKRLMKSLELKSPVLKFPETSSAADILEDRRSDCDDGDTSLVDYEIGNSYDVESDASDAGVVFL